MSTVIISDRYLFLVYAVLNLGSTDHAFLTTICHLLKETTLRTSLAFVLPKAYTVVLLFHLPATFAEWFFRDCL